MSSSEDHSTERKGKAERRDINRLLSVRLPVTAVLGQKRMKMADVLGFRVGTILELDKSSDDLLDLVLGSHKIGRGEAVRTQDNFGLQIIEMGSISDTIRKLGSKAKSEK